MQRGENINLVLVLLLFLFFVLKPSAEYQTEKPQEISQTNGEFNSVRKHNYNCMLNDGIY